MAPLQPMTVTRQAMHINTRTMRPRPLRLGKTSNTRNARLAPPLAANHPDPRFSLLVSGCGGVVLTVKETCPVPVMEFGFTKHADCVSVDGMVQVRLIRDVKFVAVFTVTLAIAAEPRAAVVPAEVREKFEIVIGTADETDSA